MDEETGIYIVLSNVIVFAQLLPTSHRIVQR